MSADASGVIWWTEVCGDSPFWDLNTTWRTGDPDLPQCFQDTALVWGSCGFLWLCAPFYLIYLATQRRLHSACGISKMNALKVVAIIALEGCCVIQFAHLMLARDTTVPAPWIAQIVYFVTYLLVLVLTRAEFRRGQHSSGVMWCFWVILCLFNIVPFRTKIRTAQADGEVADMVTFATFYVAYGFMLIALCLHLFPDTAALKEERASPDLTGERTPLLEAQRIAPSASTSTAPSNEKPECPEVRASFLSRIIYTWTTGLLLQGYKQTLNANDLWALQREDQAIPNVNRFYSCWRRSSKLPRSLTVDIREGGRASTDAASSGAHAHGTWRLNASLIKALWRCFGLEFSLLALYEIATIALTFMRPTILDFLIGYVEADTHQVWQGYLFAILMFVITIVRAVFTQQMFKGKLIIGLRIRSALTGSVYRKSLLLANSERQNYSVGEIVNFMSVDAQRISDSTFFLHNMWAAPVNIVVAMVMLWGYLGPSSLAGLGILIFLMLINFFLTIKIKKLQVEQMKTKDKRLKLTNEVLSGIRVLKLYAWEGAFQDKLKEIRDLEVNFILKAAYYISGTAISMTCAPVLYTVIAFTIFILGSQDAVLSAKVAFVSLSLVNSLTRPLSFLPIAIANIVQALVSLERITKFLNGKELDPEAVQNRPSGNAVELEDGTFSWAEDSEMGPTLRNINLTVKEGSLTAIVGQVGCGKSSLLAALLGEMHKDSGRINVSGSVAYVPQEAWIRNKTLQKNILFGLDMDRTRYDSIVEACALEPDLRVLPGGDQTEIGEKGINLSGGQKQRVSLARAIYLNNDIYLLDDPLAAVDAHVGKHIFEKVIGSTGCLRHKTRILVTHGLTHLSKADHIIVMTNGVISEQGTYAELLRHNGAFSELIRVYLSKVDHDEEEDDEEKDLREELLRQISQHSDIGEKSDRSEAPATPSESDGQQGTIRQRKRSSRSKSRSDKDAPAALSGAADSAAPTGKKLIDFESAEVGGVKWRVFMVYMRSLGCLMPVLVLMCVLLQMGADLGSNIWLSEWSKDSSSPNVTADPNLRVGVYGGLGALSALTIFVQTVALAIATTTAARALHERLLASIVKAPMSFFDTTPTGRVLNRFSQDMNTVDAQIRFTITAILRGLSGLITTIIAISYTSPIFLVMVPPLSVGYYFIQRFYIMTSNQLRRQLNVRTSPIYSHFGESISGASSIRAYKLQTAFTSDSDRYLDRMQEARYPSIITNRWLSIWLECLGALIVFFCSLYAVINGNASTGGLVGLSISYSLTVTDRLAFFVRNMSDLENNIVSVERIDEYSKVPSEAPWVRPDTIVPRDWPANGEVEFRGYSTRYREGLDLVLKDVSFNLEGGLKVGIVGRTGAGKSSMTLGLFRLIEPTGGSILIDKVVTTTLGLHQLRSKLTIIPQDPVLFSGTLRFNMDPFSRHSDEELWQALTLAHLRDYVASVPKQLEYECGEGGLNLSVGQRQLVCLARALLRRSKILVLDEATAAVDPETDELIQKTIRTEFNDCTVITIAHRINTVMDYDRILVLDKGRIVEFDTPDVLLSNTGSIFYSMCRDANLV